MSEFPYLRPMSGDSDAFDESGAHGHDGSRRRADMLASGRDCTSGDSGAAPDSASVRDSISARDSASDCVPASVCGSADDCGSAAAQDSAPVRDSISARDSIPARDSASDCVPASVCGSADARSLAAGSLADRFAAGIRSFLLKAGLVWRFYRSSLLLPCLCVSAALAWPATMAGGPNVPTLCLTKAVCYAPILYLLFSLGPRRFYYYANLGLPRTRLVAWCCVLDFLIFIALARTAALFAAIHRAL